MRSQELLTAITNGPTAGAVQGIFFSKGEQLVPFTSIRMDSAGDLVLFVEPDKTALSVKELYTQLMLHKNYSVTFWQSGEKLPIYGFKESEGKIIV